MPKVQSALLALSLIALPMIAAKTAAQEMKPNIVLIMADDIGLGDLSYYHTRRTSDPPVVNTPHLDRLVAEGMRFSDAHSPASLCAPTRFSMLTGNYSFRMSQPYGVWSPTADSQIEPNFTTVGRIAKAGGYHTAFFGKWGLGSVWDKSIWQTPDKDFSKITIGARHFGFDYALELPQGIQDTPFAFYENGEFLPMEPGAELVQIDAQQTRFDTAFKQKDKGGLGDSSWDPRRAGPILANKVVSYIERRAAASDDQPFFIYYCTQAVHIPHTPPAELNGQRVHGATIASHGDMIVELDLQVGMLVDALKANGMYENTLFVFTSDNGGLSHTNEMKAAGHVTSNGLRAAKGSIYEGGHRVPFLAVWPGRIPADTESSVPIVGLDMVATVASLAGQTLDRAVVRDSVNLLPVMTQESEGLTERVLAHQGGSRNPHFALREGRWKLIVAGGSNKQFGPVEPVALFDLETNLRERESDNLVNAPEHQEKIARMHKRYLQLRLEDGETINALVDDQAASGQ